MKWKINFGKRVLSLLLCLVMVVCMLPTTAFAAESEPADPDNSGTDVIGSENVNDPDGEDEADDTVEPTEINAGEGKNLIPDDADVETTSSVNGNTATTTTDTTWEYQDKDLMDAANAELGETGANQYGEKELVSDKDEADIVDTLKGDDAQASLDDIADGKYVKKEEQTKQDVTDVTVKGEQHETSSSTVYPDGQPASDSYSVEGEQTTETTIATTTKTTTTEVTKDTDPEVKTTEEPVGSEEIKTESEVDSTTGDKKTSTGTETKYDKTEVEVTLEGVHDKNAVQSGELTVSKDNDKTDKDESKATATGKATSTKMDKVTKDLLTALEGWNVEVGEATYKVNLDENGTVYYTNSAGARVDGIEVNVTTGEDGGYYITAQKVSRTTTQTGVEQAMSSTKGGPTPGKADPIVWAEDGYEQVGDPIPNEDGSVTVKYVKKGTADRTDTNAWTEVTTRTDGVQEVVETVTVGAKVTNGDYTITAVWGGVEDKRTDESHSDAVIIVLGPSQTVIQYAINSRNSGNNGAISNHIIVGNAYKDANAADIAASSAMVDSGNLTLAGGVFQSTILINDARGPQDDYHGSPWMRRLTDGTNNFYVYCAEHGKADPINAEYDLVNVGDHNLYSANADHIQYVVENGWWGTDSGVGSLTNVQGFVNKYKTDNQISTIKVDGEDVAIDASVIDEGIAMAATQAAIWYYTSAESGTNNQIPDENVFTHSWTGNQGHSDKNLSEAQQAAAMALFKALIAKNTDVSDKINVTTDFIDEDDITSASIQVVEKVDAKSVEDLTNAVRDSLKEEYQNKAATWTDDDEDLYKTNVSVTLAIVPSRLGSEDLMVYVYCGDKIVGSKRVESGELADNGGKVTIENVVLKSGDGVESNVKFHLEGTQYLQNGAYLFTAPVDAAGETTSQTMVGYVNNGIGAETKKHTVDLEVSMSFNVSYTNSSAVGSVSATVRTDTYEEYHEITRDKTSTQEVKEYHEQTVTVTTKVSSSETEKEATTETNTTEALFWADSVSHNYPFDPGTPPSNPPSDTPNNPNTPEDDDDVEIPEPETPLAEMPVEEIEIPDEETPLEELEIPDEEIPLADVPQTGDVSAQWCVMTAMAAAGLMVLVMIERKKREEG